MGHVSTHVSCSRSAGGRRRGGRRPPVGRPLRRSAVAPWPSAAACLRRPSSSERCSSPLRKGGRRGGRCCHDRRATAATGALRDRLVHSELQSSMEARLRVHTAPDKLYSLLYSSHLPTFFYFFFTRRFVHLKIVLSHCVAFQ